MEERNVLLSPELGRDTRARDMGTDAVGSASRQTATGWNGAALGSAVIDWAVAIFARNEAPDLGCCIRRIAACARQAGRGLHVDVLLNGTTDASIEVAGRAIAAEGLTARIWLIAHADKSNAINAWIDHLRPREARHYICVDAYAHVEPSALAALTRALERHPYSHIATGVPANSRSARHVTEATLRGGVVNGQLYAIRPEFLDRMAASGLRIPIGHYRGDGLLGSFACHDLDAFSPWDSGRIVGVAEARWQIRSLTPLWPRDIRRQVNRRIRQARGVMESAAVKWVIYAHGYAALPAHSDDLLRAWMEAGNEVAPVSLAQRFFLLLAKRRLTRALRPEQRDLLPRLTYETPADGGNPSSRIAPDGRPAGNRRIPDPNAWVMSGARIGFSAHRVRNVPVA